MAAGKCVIAGRPLNPDRLQIKQLMVFKWNNVQTFAFVSVLDGFRNIYALFSKILPLGDSRVQFEFSFVNHLRCLVVFWYTRARVRKKMNSKFRLWPENLFAVYLTFRKKSIIGENFSCCVYGFVCFCATFVRQS